MLPDYSETKRLFSKLFQIYIRQKAHSLSPMRHSQTRFLHEGRGMRVSRADRSESKSQTEELTGMMEIRLDEIEHLTASQVLAKFDALAAQLVGKQTRMFLTKMEEDIPEIQQIDARGKQLTASVVFEMFEALETEFYPDGMPHEIHVLGGLFTPERMNAVEQEILASPELQQRWTDLMNSKKEKWRDREASRKLVG